VVLPGTSAREVHLLFQDAGPPLEIAELFLYGPDEPEQPAAGQAAAQAALQAARRGDWDEARERYREAARLEPHRASRHAAVARSTWRAQHRRRPDVESLDDGGPELVARR
jgi:hypothetical protein